MEDVPSNLKSAAILQLVSGLLNMFVVSGTVYFLATTVCGTLTIFLGGLGALCGFGACALWPIGLIEVIAGGVTLANPRQGAGIMKMVVYLEFVSVLFGGLLSAVAGGVVMSMLKDDEVVAFLEG